MERNTMSYKATQFLMFAGPALILFCMVIIIPFVYGLYLTFTSWDGVSASKPFVGIANYVSAFKDYYFWSAIGRTLIYSAFAVIFVNIVAFVLAYLVTSGVKGQNFFRAGFFIPNLIGGIVLGYVWKFVFNRAFVAIGAAFTDGTVPSLLSSTGGAMFCLIVVDGRRHVLPDPGICLAIRRLHDADLRGRLHGRFRQPEGSGDDRRVHAVTGNAQRHDSSDEDIICNLYLPEHHQMLRCVRCQPVVDKR